MVRMISFDDSSTSPASALTASATTPKPRPASPARLASTEALNATSRGCSATCVTLCAAPATSRSVAPTVPTSAPTPSTAWRTRSTASSPPADTLPISPCDAMICATWPATAATAAAPRSEARALSSIRPLTSAASRPRFEARALMDWMAARTSAAGALGGAATHSRAGGDADRPNDFNGNMGALASTHDQYARNFTRSRAIDWLCNWHMRDSVTFSTAAISFRFMSCS